jgi:mannose-6-phosphate isomerase-like protein (cupin superfamily)
MNTTATPHQPVVSELFAGNRFTWHVTTPELSLAEVLVQPGGEPALHIHEREDETYMVIEGELTFQRGDERFDAGPGDVVFLPRGVVHGFAMRSERAKLLIACTPGGLEAPFHALSEPADADADLPELTGPPPAEAINAMEVAFGAYGVTFVGPPLPVVLASEA